ncbi:MAG: hypothetical protein KME38_27435 [Spirirestis rafaelensis WJT71-NPBG6]|jgi:hypothetical protein|nr:hypothetical protein [Spirirestis rafaelensis WJT71-NPBG6]
MIISDLNHLEAVEGADVVGGTYTTYDKEYIDVEVKFNFNNKFKSYVDLKGNTASSKGLADAYGKNSKTDVFVQTYTEEGVGSSSIGIAGSASS